MCKFLVLITTSMYLLFVFAYNAPAQGFGTLDLSVVDGQNEPVEQALVIVTNIDDDTPHSTRTNATGKAVFTLLEPGRYILTVEKNKYKVSKSNIVVPLNKVTVLSPPIVLTSSETLLQPSESDTKPIITYGRIKLDILPVEATVYLDGKEIPLSKNGNYDIADVPTGEHLLRFTCSACNPETQYVTVEEGVVVAISQKMTSRRSTISIKALPQSTVFINDQYKGITSSEGQLDVGNIEIGKYKIKIVKEGYKEINYSMSVDSLGTTLIFRPTMKPLTSPFFFDRFNNGLKLWKAPPDWKINQSGRLIMRGPTKIGFPVDKIFEGLDGQFTFKMLNGVGFAWALHLQENNCYLFALCMNERKQPVLCTYICENGKLDLTNFVNSVRVVIDLNPEYFYTVRVAVRGSRFETFITPNQGPDAGIELPVDVFIDEKDLFPYGNIGFSAIDGVDVLLSRVSIKTIERDKKIKTIEGDKK